MARLRLFVAAAAFALASCDAASHPPPDLTACAPLDLSKPIGALELTRMFEGGGAVTRPTDMRVLPDGRAFVASQDGIVWMAPEVSAEAALEPWLDLEDRVEAREACCREEGLLSLAFHPDFEDNGQFFVMYSRQTGRKYSDTVISRFDVEGGEPNPDSEEVLIRLEQPSYVHNGGQLRFGPDGFLYFSMGDGGGSHDPNGNGQDRSNLFGTISRIDVDRTQSDRPYGIPENNPFLDDEDAAPEIFAYGFRNAWRLDVHPETGEIWAGDVGQASFEELDIVVPGGNYGWKVREGDACMHPDPEHDCEPPGYVAPIHVYGRDHGKSITAGVFYQSDALPHLKGQFLFSDFHAGTLWTVQGDTDAGYEVVSLMETGLAVSTFARGPDGEVYLTHWDWEEAEVYRLDPGRGTKEPKWAPRLSETGCFEDLKQRRFVDPVVSYSVQAPLWSDGADKERALVLPVDGRIKAPGSRHEPWELPVGAATIKTFLRDGRPLETRFLVQVEDERWFGATYRWNEQSSDARLLEGSEPLSVEIDGEPWTFPSRNDCLKCHTRASGRVLGLVTGQVAGAGEGHDPLATLEQRGGFEGGPPERTRPWPAVDDDEAPLDRRARAYLASNCASCHRPGGPTPTALDLRYEIDLRDTGACDAQPREDLGLERARLIAPGAPARSVLLERLRTNDPLIRMPPLGREQVDEAGVELIEAWIESLDDCK